MNSTDAVYSACQLCTAKWFGPSMVNSCPRCGATHILHTRATPPWSWQKTRRPETRPNEKNSQNSHSGRSTLPTSSSGE